MDVQHRVSKNDVEKGNKVLASARRLGGFGRLEESVVEPLGWYSSCLTSLLEPFKRGYIRYIP